MKEPAREEGRDRKFPCMTKAPGRGWVRDADVSKSPGRREAWRSLVAGQCSSVVYFDKRLNHYV